MFKPKVIISLFLASFFLHSSFIFSTEKSDLESKEDIFLPIPLLKFKDHPPKILSAPKVNRRYQYVRTLSTVTSGEAVVLKVLRDLEEGELIMRLMPYGFVSSSESLEKMESRLRLNSLTQKYFSYITTLNPNVVNVHDHFFVPIKHYSTLEGSRSCLWCDSLDRPIPTSFDGDSEANSIYHHVTVMEALDQAGLRSSLNTLKEKNNWSFCQSQIYFRFVQGFLRMTNKRLGVVWSDDGLHNWGFLAVEKDVFLGKRVSDYKYWHYMIPGYDIYIPIANVTLKRFDPGYMFSAPSAKKLTKKDSEELWRYVLEGTKNEKLRCRQLKMLTTLPEGVSEEEVLHVPAGLELGISS